MWHLGKSTQEEERERRVPEADLCPVCSRPSALSGVALAGGGGAQV